MNNNENPNSGGEEVRPRVGWLMVVSVGLGVWAMLGAILAGIGVHGLCVMPRERKGQNTMDGQDG